ncbi:GntR family transcriptional regulator [Pelagibius sp.]|uniref:GntR family transcriptional regulator n=1 Tax=Pelagibius sp. TaxID=1931238 RepID=UPI0026179C87|nr:GntR family transcriptional regulator [Pelagibius sp.]
MIDSLDLRALVGDEAPLSRRPSLAEEAADSLREMILLEKLPPGMALPERDLSEILGISRTPLREAIRLLEIEGLVEYSATRRPRVADPSLEELTHCLMVQGALEGLAGRQACLHASDADLAEIAALNREMTEIPEEADPLHAFRLDMAFHCAIVKAAGNPPLIETHRQYNARLWRARFVSSKWRLGREKKRSNHREIVDALLARDQAGAEAALRGHLAVDAVAHYTAAIQAR